jgi:hypothetical protein
VCDALCAQADVFKDWHHFFDDLGLGVLNVQYRGRFPEGIKDELLLDVEEQAAEIATALEAELKVRVSLRWPRVNPRGARREWPSSTGTATAVWSRG